LLIGEDPLDHARLEAKVYWGLQTIGRSSKSWTLTEILVLQCQSEIRHEGLAADVEKNVARLREIARCK